MNRLPLFYLFISFAFFTMQKTYAQEVIRCATDEVLNMNELQHPGTRQLIEDANALAVQWMIDNPGGTRAVITIPVVVHVVYHTNSQNISDEQVKSQIEVLNEDYRRQNVDTVETPAIYKPLGADCNIEFCLAAYDPNGDSTSGITRTYTDTTIFSTSDNIKSAQMGGADGWPAKHYLNIWVCNLDNDVLGYATLPQTNSGNSTTDGVVILYKAFGREGVLSSTYNLGRTCTHEVGHWLGLVHIWAEDGCGNDDGIADTPLQDSAHFQCPTFPNVSCGNSGDMSMNYMDYTDDGCMNIFTFGQSAKMNSVVQTSRSSILTSPGGCQGVYFSNDAAATKILSPIDTIGYLSFQPQLQITNRGINNLTSVQVNYQVDGQTPAVYQYIGNLATFQSEVITLPLYFTGEGDHLTAAWTSNPNNVNDEYIFNDTISGSFTVLSSVSKNSFTVTPSPTSGAITLSISNPSAGDLNLRVVNTMGQVVQQHYLSLNTTSIFSIDLSNVPAGIYFLYAEIGFDFVTKKVMVWR